jgi:predicted nucleotidyltransferase
VEKAVLYGSRAKGTARSGSDIDLVLFGNEVDQETVDRIAVALDDLLLPYQFDLSIFSRISHADLLDHIQRVGVLFYEKSAVGTQI